MLRPTSRCPRENNRKHLTGSCWGCFRPWVPDTHCSVALSRGEKANQLPDTHIAASQFQICSTPSTSDRLPAHHGSHLQGPPCCDDVCPGHRSIRASSICVHPRSSTRYAALKRSYEGPIAILKRVLSVRSPDRTAAASSAAQRQVSRGIQLWILRTCCSLQNNIAQATVSALRLWVCW